MNRRTLYISGVVVAALVLLLGALYFFALRTQTSTNQSFGSFFGIGGNVSTTQTNGSADTTNTPVNTTSAQKVFKIANGPIAAATFIQTFSPTTTLARYVMADNGHVLDMPIDVPGAVPRPVSNTTIPGVVNAVWGNNGTSTILQYVDSGTVKTVFVAFATTSDSAAKGPLQITFLPNNIASYAFSPDAQHVAYLLKSSFGADVYTAHADGTNTSKLFSLPFSQALVSWPAQSTLLAQTKSASGIPGIAFSADAKSGALTPLLYTPGLAATVNGVFSKIVYRIDTDTGTTYSHDIVTGKDISLAGNPLPEKCIWSKSIAEDIYCAVPLDLDSQNYSDSWHQGLSQNADSILKINSNDGTGIVIATKGSGGFSAPIEHMALSQDGNYLLFITRGDQSLWGVRLR